MAESGLSIGAPELRAEIGYLAGYGRTSGNWSADQLADINRHMLSGLRRVYYPPAVSKEVNGYEWTWLRPFTTLTTVSGTEDYDLPDDFARFIGPLHYPAEENRNRIVVIPAHSIIEYRSRTSSSGGPRYVAERWKASTGAAGQRKEALLWPNPDNVWVLEYQYEAYAGPLTDTYPYPLGGMKLSELVKESCLAVVEMMLDDAHGIHHQEYLALLVDAVTRDKRNGAHAYGQMGHREMLDGRPFHHGDTGGTYPITYKGEDV